MRKHESDVLPPAVFRTEISAALHQLSQLAVAIHVAPPPLIDEFDQLSEAGQFDCFVTSRARRQNIDEMWQEVANALIAQALAATEVSPDGREPSSYGPNTTL